MSILRIFTLLFLCANLNAQKYIEIQCYTCESIVSSDCTSCDKWFEKNYELFKGLLVQSNGRVTPIYSDYQVRVNGDIINLHDKFGNFIAIDWKKTAFPNRQAFLDYISDCSCGVKCPEFPPIEVSDISYCEVPPIVTIESEYDVIWEDENGEIVNTGNEYTVGAGTYSVYTQSEDCKSSVYSFTVIQNTPPAISLPTEIEVCPNQITDIECIADGTFLWSTGETSPIIMAGVGTYTVTVTDTNGCESTASVNVTESGDGVSCDVGEMTCTLLDTDGTGDGEVELMLENGCSETYLSITVDIIKKSDMTSISSATFADGAAEGGIAWTGTDFSDYLYESDGTTPITTFDANTTYVFKKRPYAIASGLAGVGLGDDYIVSITYESELGCDVTLTCMIEKFFEGRDYWLFVTTSNNEGAFGDCDNTGGASNSSKSGGLMPIGLFDVNSVEVSYDQAASWNPVPSGDIFTLPTNAAFEGFCMEDDNCEISQGMMATTIADPSVLANIAGVDLISTAIACDSRTVRAAGNFDSFVSPTSIPSVGFTIIEKHLANGGHPQVNTECPYLMDFSKMYISNSAGLTNDPLSGSVYTSPFTHPEIVFNSGVDNTTHTFMHAFPTEGVYTWRVEQYKLNDYQTTGGNPVWSNAGCNNASATDVMNCIGCTVDSGTGADTTTPTTYQTGLYVIASY